MKKITNIQRNIIVFVLLGLCSVPSIAEVGSNWIQQWNIRWTFDRNLSTTVGSNTYQWGQFANGDYWVVGPVNIISITPPSKSTVAGDTDQYGRAFPTGTIINGSMVNIVPGDAHGYCSNVGGWNSQLNAAWGVDASHPLSLAAGTSLVSTVSKMPLAPDYSYSQRASVLTVLAQAPAPGSFRPPYCGTDKTIRYNKSQLDYSKLASLPQVPGTPTLSSLEAGFEKVWLDHKASYTGRYLHPYDNMPNYGCGMAELIGIAGMALNLKYNDDPALNNSLKEKLLVSFVQYGIDVWGVYKAGGTDIWKMDGGHGPGRKLPILFAGIMLGNPDMANIGKHNISDPFFGEDHTTYYLYRSEVQRWIGADGKYPADNEGRDDPISYYHEEDYFSIDLQNKSIPNWVTGADYTQDTVVLNDNAYYSCRGRHTSNAVTEPGTGSSWQTYWRALESHYLGIPEFGKWYEGGAPLGAFQGRWISRGAQAYTYRDIWGWPLDGIVMTAHIMGLKEAWNHDALFDYMDRYVAWLGGQDTFIKNMWDTYRADYGPIWPDTGETDTVSPLAPSNLTSPQQTSTSIQLSWTAPGAAGDGDLASRYEIHRNGSFLTISISPSCTISGLTPNTAYSFAVYSVDDCGNCSSGAATGTFSTAEDTPPAQNAYYLSPGGSSSNTGADWNNALRELPAVLNRDATYYLAAGTYSKFTISNTPAGTDMITIKKATLQDHGTNTGWNDSYASSPVVVNGILFQNASYVTVDGQDENRIQVIWQGTEPGGSTVGFLNSQQITVRYCDLDGNFQMAGGLQSLGACNVVEVSESSYITVDQCKVHNGADDGMSLWYGDHLTISNNEVYDLHACGTDIGCGPCNNGHSDGLELFEVSNSEFTGNFVHNIPSTSALFLGGLSACSNLLFANNIFYNNTNTGFAAYIQRVNGVKVYNNVFWGVVAGRYGGLSIGNNVTGMELYNNIILSVNYSHMGAVYNAAEHHGDYNLIGVDIEEYPVNTNDQVVSDPGFAFINGAGGPLTIDPVKEDFMLEENSPAVNAGTTVSILYDIVNTLRPQDSAYDIGAFESISGTTPTTYTLSISTANGTVTKSPDKSTYTAGETVILTAQPNSGYTFTNWTGDAAGTTNPLSIVMNTNKTLTANFTSSSVPIDELLNTPVLSQLSEQTFNTLNTFETISTTGWNVGGTTITLWANPDNLSGSHYIFGHTNASAWGNRIQIYCSDALLNLGLGDTHSRQTNLATMQTGQWYFISLSWNGMNYTVQVNDTVVGTGTYTGLTGFETFADLGNNGMATDRTEPFVGVLDDIRIYNRALSDIEATALYNYGRTSGSIPTTYTLTTTAANGTITKSPDKTSYNAGETVTLTAAAGSGYFFTGWSGDASGTGNPVTVTMDTNKTVTANFIASVPTGHWRLNDYSSASTADSSGNGYTASLIGQPAWGHPWADEDFIIMNTKNQAVQIPSAAIRPQAGTIALWVSPASTSGAQYLIGHVYNGSNRIALLTVGGNLAVSLGSQSLIQQDIAALPANQPAHIVLTWDNGQYTVYIDGEQKAAGTYSGLTSLYSSFDVGNYGDPSMRIVGFLGQIDDVRTYNRALSTNEIQALYQTYDTKENREIAFVVEGVDDLGNPISYTASNLPEGAHFEIGTQDFYWQPWYDQAGQYNVLFNAAGQPSQNVTITVEEVLLQDWYRRFLEANGKL